MFIIFIKNLAYYLYLSTNFQKIFRTVDWVDEHDNYFIGPVKPPESLHFHHSVADIYNVFVCSTFTQQIESENQYLVNCLLFKIT